MFPIPVDTVHFHESCVGQQINGALKEVDGIAAWCRDAEREPFIAPAGIAHKIRPKSSDTNMQ